ncbi:carboxypeptidase regulatory-like domain-containing protein [Actinoallomurus purpureus]|uniref:MSCRAMM family protein n=1 Tax=Actinoallomurus purpureus TaxID=478114 RepID=UPI002092ECC0|nr:carboxypeptidase regulatory-like domain-containing protein [Actinoallomurus purpureus]MCO6005090.1 carboxypeptidase regulatory-like domain-containing protein [Actinoallomurus purpureus]
MTENTALSETLTVFGTVRRNEGPPVADAVVTLADMAGHKIGSAYTGMDGEYRLTVNNGGTYLMIASAPGHEPIASLVAVGGGTVRHDMTIAGVGGLIGIVRISGTREPVADAAITVTDVQGDVIATARSTDGGGFSFISLPEGGYTLVASAPGQRPVAAAVTVRQGTQTRQDLELRARGGLNGEAWLAGRPYDGARITLMDQTGSIVGTTVSGVDGAFSFGDLEPTTYTLVAAGHGPAAVPVQITGGRAVEADVTLTA